MTQAPKAAAAERLAAVVERMAQREQSIARLKRWSATRRDLLQRINHRLDELKELSEAADPLEVDEIGGTVDFLRREESRADRELCDLERETPGLKREIDEIREATEALPEEARP